VEMGVGGQAFQTPGVTQVQAAGAAEITATGIEETRD
jgi:hypothetical protein